MKRKAKGFTLVEIMIVVAIIGLLVAIALPNFMRARKKSMIKAAQASLKQIEGAVEQARLDGVVISDYTDTNIVDQAICPTYLKMWPVCPGGGGFVITAGGSNYTAVISDVNGGNGFTAYDDVQP